MFNFLKKRKEAQREAQELQELEAYELDEQVLNTIKFAEDNNLTEFEVYILAGEFSKAARKLKSMGYGIYTMDYSMLNSTGHTILTLIKR